MVTVYEDSERISAALRAGACGSLLKRCQPEELVTAVRETRLGGVPMQREIARKVIAAFQQLATTATGSGELRLSELIIVELLTHGLSNKEIGNRLGLSHSIVCWHLGNVFAKLRVASRVEAVLKFKSASADSNRNP